MDDAPVLANFELLSSHASFQYVFIFFVGSYRVWKLLRVPTLPEFPYSTRHSIKVMVLGWLGIMPMVIFAFRYANGAHDDFEWVRSTLKTRKILK
jgi:hypothetical protein